MNNPKQQFSQVSLIGLINRLLEILGIAVNNDGEYLRLTYSLEFEPFGRAIEDWQGVWRLYLMKIPYYWKSTTGWKLGESKDPMSFYGKTPTDVVNQAIAFIEEINKDEL